MKVIAKTKKKHRAKDFAAFLNEVEKAAPEGLEAHVILDDPSAHNNASAVKPRCTAMVDFRQ